MIYGVALLANFMTETSTAILQLANKYKSIALFNLIQNIVTAIWIIILFFMHGNLFEILTAYLVGKFVFGFGISIAGVLQLNKLIGRSLVVKQI